MAKKPEKKKSKPMSRKDMKKTTGGMGWDVMPVSRGGSTISSNEASKLTGGGTLGGINTTGGG